MGYIFLKRTYFPGGKMIAIEKISEAEMLRSLTVGSVILGRFTVTESYSKRGERADALIEVQLLEEERSNDDDRFRFVVEAKSDSTPRSVESAIAQVKTYAQPEVNPLILVPYLSPERLQSLERAKVSGIDLCGNGVVIIPRRLYVLSTGQPNRYPDSRSLSNPYRGRSAMVARMLLARPRWESLNELRTAIHSAGIELSLSQTSKAVAALQEELILAKQSGGIVLQEPLKLLDRLGQEWKNNPIRRRQALRLSPGTEIGPLLSAASQLKWAVTGASSVSQYVMFAQGGPRQIAVSDLELTQSLLQGKPEPVANFADIELLETDEAGFYFANEVDTQGVRWASRLQTWLELQAGDARQQDGAQQVRAQIVREVQQ
jgi:hypothetical protein